MKIIHCGDIHLDSKLSANYSKQKGKERNFEILNTFVRMVDYAEKNDVEGILICGDLFDSKNVSMLTKKTIKEVVEGHPSIIFFYLKGNHDSADILNVFSEIPDNFFTFSDSWNCYSLGDKNRVLIHGVELNSSKNAGILANISLDSSKINIVMLHGQTVESAVSFGDEFINLKELRNKGIGYLALGHIHEYKDEFLDGLCKYVYCGCLEPRGFDEPGSHGFVLLDVNEDTGVISEEFVPFAARDLKEIFVDVTGAEDSVSIIEKVRQALLGSDVKSSDYVKIVLTGDLDAECEKDEGFIFKSFEEEFYLVKIYDKTGIKVDFEKYRNDASLKGEFVRKVLFDPELTEEEKGEIIRIGLLALFERRVLL